MEEIRTSIRGLAKKDDVAKPLSALKVIIDKLSIRCNEKLVER